MADKRKPGDWWTAAELAQAAGVNSSRVRQLILAGTIKAEKWAGVWRIADKDARRWLDERRGG